MQLIPKAGYQASNNFKAFQVPTLRSILALSASICLLCACAGGGGGSGSSPAATPAPINPNTTLASAAPTAAETTNRSNYASWLSQANVPYANQLSTGNGAGVTIGIADSGVQANHASLNGQIVAAQDFTGSGTTADTDGHGTHVSAIAAGTLANGGNVQGVAPGANIAMAKVLQAGSGTPADVANGIDWLVNTQHVPILSLSLGSTAPTIQTNIQNAVTNGVLVVVAAGNASQTNAVDYPAAYAGQAWANNQIIVVGAVDSANIRASFSNYDPTLANWTVYAPGVNIYSAVPTDSYATKSGTSMATPMVAGQAALIKSNWNFLSANQISSIIFKTARHLCSDGTSGSSCTSRTTADPVYGWGLIDVGASLQPIGTLTYVTPAGQTLNYSGALIASPKSGLLAGLTGLTTTANDSFNRGYVVKTPFAQAPNPSAEIPETESLNADIDDKTRFSSFADDKEVSLSMLWSSGTHQWNLATGAQQVAQAFNGERFDVALQSQADVADRKLYRMMDAPSAFAWSTGNKDLQYGLIAAQSNTRTNASSVSAARVHWKPNGYLGLLVEAGSLQERNTLMGLQGTGMLDTTGVAPRTAYLRPGASTPLNDLPSPPLGMYDGMTPGQSTPGTSLVEGFSDMHTQATSLALSVRGLVADQDLWTFKLEEPLHAVSGNLRVMTASQNADGSMRYQSNELPLSGTGKETAFTVAMQQKVWRDARLQAYLSYRTQPNGDASAADMTLVGMLLSKRF